MKVDFVFYHMLTLSEVVILTHYRYRILFSEIQNLPEHLPFPFIIMLPFFVLFLLITFLFNLSFGMFVLVSPFSPPDRICLRAWIRRSLLVSLRACGSNTLYCSPLSYENG